MTSTLRCFRSWTPAPRAQVICTSKDGDQFWRMPETYIRGNTIKYLRVPDEVIDKVKDEPLRREGGPRLCAARLATDWFPPAHATTVSPRAQRCAAVSESNFASLSSRAIRRAALQSCRVVVVWLGGTGDTATCLCG